ncbi:ATP-binding protein [Actinomycetes bacterium M1A6_2h]
MITLEVLVVVLLRRISPENPFGAVFLLGVLVISAGWGLWTALTMFAASTVAYAYFHTAESPGSLFPAIVVFIVLALVCNILAGQARLRGIESYQRRLEADLLAELARTMLRRPYSAEVGETVSRRLSDVLDLPSPDAVLEWGAAGDREGFVRIVLRDGDIDTATLFVPDSLSASESRRIDRVVPALEALLAAARDREALHQHTVSLAQQQAALRRVATLVALRADPADVYPTAVAELALSLGAEHVSLVRFDPGSFCTVLAGWDDDTNSDPLMAGERLELGGRNICTEVRSTGNPAVVDYADATGPIGARLRKRGLSLGVGVPIKVEGRTWGAVVVGAADRTPIPDISARLTDFADLIGTAVFNSETREQLTQSRARIIAAADQARRTIERDLHDGAQQRIVSLSMELRATQTAIPADQTVLRERLDHTVDELGQLHAELQELSRGIHPAILSRGGLGPALKTLARRSPVPVSLGVDVAVRLPERIEVAAYYVVAESLTNTAKYANATGVSVTARLRGGLLTLTVIDDGSGGAAADGGTGLLGLRDRIEAIGGTFTVSSPEGRGTTIAAAVPITG